MIDAQSLDTAHVRLIKAVAVVLAIVLVIPGASVIATYLRSSLVEVEAPVGIDSAYILSADDAFASLDRLEEASVAGEAELPGWFESEVGLPSGARDVRVSAGETVVGYVVDGDARDAYERLVVDMEDKGWTAIPLAGEVGATFIREEGRCTWILATCTQAGDATSVVTRCAGE